MAAYEWFSVGTINTVIQNIKNKAEAYGWTIDFFGAYSGNNRLHLHNSDGAHFELWYANNNTVYVAACTGYVPASTPFGQPTLSGVGRLTFDMQYLVIVSPHSIYIKTYALTNSPINFQFGCIVDKVGSWTGGACLSNLGQYRSPELWGLTGATMGQVYINNAWNTEASSGGGVVSGACSPALYTKMPFAYSGGILPTPVLLTQFDAVSPSYRHPIGYAPDVKSFAGGDIYKQLEEITIDGDVWVGVHQTELAGGISYPPNLLIRLAA